MSATDLPRLFLDPEAWAGDRVRLTPEQWHYLVRVMRLNTGAPFWALDGRGARWLAHLPAVDGTSREATVKDREPAPGELAGHVTLVQALLKGDRQEWILQKATELGVHAILPVMTERTVVRLDADRADRRHSRWMGILREAAEQCERGRLPDLAAVQPLTASVPSPPSPDEFMGFGHPREAGIPALADAIRTHRGSRIRIFIGPEGGFTTQEVTWLLAQGAKPVSLGSRILRAETACVAALAVLAAVLEEN